MLYGRALNLSPVGLTAGPYPVDRRVATELGPFVRRLYLQRVSVMLVRALILSAVTSTAVLLARAFGVSAPLPAAPLIAAGATVAAVALLAVVQRPSARQMAHRLDRDLGMREQIGSALDTDPEYSRMAALLHHRALQVLSETPPARVLAWPRFDRELWMLALATVVALICGLIAANAPAPRRQAAVQSVTPRGARASISRTHVTRRAVRLAGVGSTVSARFLVQRRTTSSEPRLMAPGGHPPATSSRSLAGRSLVLHASQSNNAFSNAGGTHAGTPTNGSPGNSGANANGAAGRPAGSANKSPGLRFNSGQNSSSGGVISPEQQALMNLQNSISSAQSATNGTSHGTIGAQSGARASLSPNTTGSQSGNASGRRGGGRGHQTSVGRSGSAGGLARRGDGRQAGSGLQRHLGPDSYNDPLGRSAHNGGGTGDRSSISSSPQGSGNGSTGAQLSDNGVTLNGSPSHGGRMIVTVGQAVRASGAAGGSLLGQPSNVIVTVPGYVAPDSNSVDANQRAIVQQYFTPPPGS